ncbi:MAG: histidine phosphatase family protein [Candidatus Buchananbacteria bacterium]
MKSLLKKTNVYLVRHGDVIGRSDFLYGRLPGYPLSQTGVKQIKRVGRWLTFKEISKIYTSPLLRTAQTAKIIGDYCLAKAVKNNLLNEWNHPWAGLYIKQIIKQDPINWQIHLKNPAKQITGEKAIQVAKRVVKFIKLVAKKHVGQNIVVVSHADTIRYGLLAWQKKDLNQLHHWPLETGDVYQLILNQAGKTLAVKYFKNSKLKNK